MQSSLVESEKVNFKCKLSGKCDRNVALVWPGVERGTGILPYGSRKDKNIIIKLLRCTIIMNIVRVTTILLWLSVKSILLTLVLDLNWYSIDCCLRQQFPLLPKLIIQSTENCGKKCSRFWLRLRHAVIMISNVRTSASKKINLMALIWTRTISTTTFERRKEKFDGFRQTVLFNGKNRSVS